MWFQQLCEQKTSGTAPSSIEMGKEECDQALPSPFPTCSLVLSGSVARLKRWSYELAGWTTSTSC
jgi:hypothetical protein